MTGNGILQIALYVAVLVALSGPPASMTPVGLMTWKLSTLRVDGISNPVVIAVCDWE